MKEREVQFYTGYGGKGLMRKKQNLSKISLEEGSESFGGLGMVVAAEGTARLKSPPCLAHSAQLLSFHPSGLPSGSLPLRTAFAESSCPSSIKDPISMLSELPSIL